MVTAIAALLLLNSAPSQAPAKQYEDPPMPKPVAQFWKKLAKAKTISVTVNSWTEKTIRTGVEHGVLELENIAEVKIQRPNLVSIHGQPPKMEQRPKENGGMTIFVHGGGGTYICDGKSAIRLHSEFHAYDQAKPMMSLTQVKDNPVNNAGLFWVLVEHPMNGLKPYVKDAKDQPPTYGFVFVIKDPKNENYQEWYYFDPKNGAPVRQSNFLWDDKGHFKELGRFEYQFWQLDAKLPKETFDTTPPKGWKLFGSPSKAGQDPAPGADR